MLQCTVWISSAAPITNKILPATVTEIDADSATLEYSGDGAPKVGDLAKIPR